MQQILHQINNKSKHKSKMIHYNYLIISISSVCKKVVLRNIINCWAFEITVLKQWIGIKRKKTVNFPNRSKRLAIYSINDSSFLKLLIKNNLLVVLLWWSAMECENKIMKEVLLVKFCSTRKRVFKPEIF